MSTVSEIFESMAYGPAPESGAEARSWIEAHAGRFGHYVGGRWVRSSDGERFDVVNPADGGVLASAAQGTAGDVDAAVSAARSALGAWQALGGHGRARHLYALARQVQKHSRLFATLESLDNGKPIRESRDIDIPLVARHFYHHAGWAQLFESELAGYAPVGVVGQIIPWNFPLLMLAWKVAPALAAGNTVVLKPAEYTPLTALLFAEVCAEAGLPAGVFNLVTGDGRTGELLVEHDGVDKIAFTGSTEVGRAIRVATAGTGRKLSLELGGKSPFLVFDDADLDSVVEGVVDAIWFNQGQVCCAGSRILAHEGIARRLEDKLRARMETLRMGDPLDKAVDIGAIVAPVQLERIRSLVRTGVEEGGRVWQPSWAGSDADADAGVVAADGARAAAMGAGCFFPPTLFTDVSPAATIAQVEIFGPVVVMMTFRTPAEAVALANDTRYGLAASVWSESINLALDVAPKLKAGTVWINSTNLFDAASGFGGYRESGFGREGGFEGMREYVVRKAEVEEEVEEETGGAGPGGAPGVRPDFEGLAAFGGAAPGSADEASTSTSAIQAIDRTAKLYIGGKQTRPDGGYSLLVRDREGRVAGEVGRGNRKDIRNAVEAAHRAAGGWASATAHNRAQVLYYLAENLDARASELAGRLTALGAADDEAAASAEVERSVRRLFTYAAWADKWDGAVHGTPFRSVTLAMREPVGVLGICCPTERPLLGLVSTVAPAIALGNAVVAVPSERWPLLATDLYQVLDTSDVPGGVVNLVTGLRDELAQVLAAHDDVDGLWYFGPREGAEPVERLSAGNMKRTWCSYGRRRRWEDAEQGEGREFLWRATEIKNIWVPYGE